MKPVLLLVEQLLVCCTLLAFLSGFIFFQPVGDHTMSSSPVPLKGGIPKVVLMVIDGLRRDHVFSLHTDLDMGNAASVKYHSHIPYVGQLLNSTQNLHSTQNKKWSGAAAFDVMTFTPTVTAPRLLSMVSGSVPGFMSIASNFGAAEVTLDNLVLRWKAAGRRIKLFGDETWSAMFPNHFVEQDPVSSFYVSDHTEVDRNVSRHLRSLLYRLKEEGTWDVAILHYLGLDHLGHTHGSEHELIFDKLKEMSDVISTLNMGLRASGCNYIVLVCGDHGMLDEGGHGGSRYEELHTAAVFLGPRLHARRSSDQLLVRQVDLSSTLAVLSGVSVPAASVGMPLLPLLSLFLDPYHLMKLYKNEAARLLDILKSASLPAGDASALMAEAEWLETKNYDLLMDLHTRAKQQLSLQTDNTSESCVGPQPPVLETSSSTTQLLEQLAALYEKTCRKSSDTLVNKMKTYDLPVLVVSASVLLLMVMGRLLLLSVHASASALKGAVLSTLMCAAGAVLLGWSVCCGVLSSSSTVCHPWSYVLWLLLPPAVYALLMLRQAGSVLLSVKIFSEWQPTASPFKSLVVVLVGGVTAHTLSMFGSSFVEEEHQTLYFLLTSALLLLLLCALRCCCLTFPGPMGLLSVFTSQTTSLDDDGDNRGDASHDSYDSLHQRNNHQLVRLRGTYDPLGGHSSRVTSHLDAQVSQADYNLAGVITSNDVRQQAKRAEEMQSKRFSCYAQASVGLLLSVAVFRAVRTWNATGDKWRHLPDSSDYLQELAPVVQACCHMVTLALLLLVDFACGPIYVLGLVHVLSYNFPVMPEQYSREFSALVVYCSALALLTYGVARNFFLMWVFRKKKPGYKSRRAAIFLLGLYPHSLVSNFYRRAKSNLWSTKSDYPKNIPKPKATVMQEESFHCVVHRFNSSWFLLLQLVKYLRLSLTLVWLLVQERSNVPLCCLLVLQSCLTSSSLYSIVHVVKLWAPHPATYQTMPQSYAAVIVLWMADAFFFAQVLVRVLS
ncbi:Type I phosphodiesterase/nucleotide pyrophosphatase/phosphate transferase [Trinorchestia longiramus]|nr:Type I phosphodiesterase/nucleotide pyrophosphatase/phosphate transferase [Trinorchestia longiramus]